MEAVSLETLATVAGVVVLFLTIVNQNKTTDAKIDSLRTEFKSDMVNLRTELKGDIDNLRTELKGDIDNLRTELKGDIDNLRTELKGDMDNLRTELKADIQRVDEKVEQANSHYIAMRESLAGQTERVENVQRQVDRIESRQTT